MKPRNRSLPILLLAGSLSLFLSACQMTEDQTEQAAVAQEPAELVNENEPMDSSTPASLNSNNQDQARALKKKAPELDVCSLDYNEDFVLTRDELLDAGFESGFAKVGPNQEPDDFDLNSDGMVDEADRFLISEKFDQNCGSSEILECIGDFDKNGEVTHDDLNEMNDNFGPCPRSSACPWDLDKSKEVDMVDLAQMPELGTLCDDY